MSKESVLVLYARLAFFDCLFLSWLILFLLLPFFLFFLLLPKPLIKCFYHCWNRLKVDEWNEFFCTWVHHFTYCINTFWSFCIIHKRHDPTSGFLCNTTLWCQLQSPSLKETVNGFIGHHIHCVCGWLVSECMCRAEVPSLPADWTESWCDMRHAKLLDPGWLDGNGEWLLSSSCSFQAAI